MYFQILGLHVLDIGFGIWGYETRIETIAKKNLGSKIGTKSGIELRATKPKSKPIFSSLKKTKTKPELITWIFEALESKASPKS